MKLLSSLEFFERKYFRRYRVVEQHYDDRRRRYFILVESPSRV